MNNQGEVLSHPHLPQAHQYKSEPKFFDVSELEGLSGNVEFDRVRSDMIQGITGTHSMDKITHLARGMKQYEGFRFWNATVTYHYRRLYGGQCPA